MTVECDVTGVAPVVTRAAVQMFSVIFSFFLFLLIFFLSGVLMQCVAPFYIGQLQHDMSQSSSSTDFCNTLIHICAFNVKLKSTAR